MEPFKQPFHPGQAEECQGSYQEMHDKLLECRPEAPPHTRKECLYGLHSEAPHKQTLPYHFSCTAWCPHWPSSRHPLIRHDHMPNGSLESFANGRRIIG